VSGEEEESVTKVKQKTAVVTGGSGHLGGNLVRTLLDRGYRVRAVVHRDRRALEGLDVEHVTGDVRDRDVMCQALDGADVVFHLAGIVSLFSQDARLFETNVLGTRSVVDAAIECKVPRFVHYSSVHALADRGGVVDEDAPLALDDPKMSYDRAKALSEQEVLKGVERGLDAVMVNPTAVLGPHDYKMSQLGLVLVAMCKGWMPALIEGGFNWVDARDVADGAIRAAQTGRTGEHYLLAGQWASVRDLAALVSKQCGKKVPRFDAPNWLVWGFSIPAEYGAKWTGTRPLVTRYMLTTLKGHRYVSHQKAAQELGYAPRSLEDTVRDTLDWYRKAEKI